ncbi:hypothetical protein NL676_032684 [Syzygium grande]|nr:hypothetical protein NL676_032684 [Syzygium grande]
MRAAAHSGTECVLRNTLRAEFPDALRLLSDLQKRAPESKEARRPPQSAPQPRPRKQRSKAPKPNESKAEPDAAALPGGPEGGGRAGWREKGIEDAPIAAAMEKFVLRWHGSRELGRKWKEKELLSLSLSLIFGLPAGERDTGEGRANVGRDGTRGMAKMRPEPRRDSQRSSSSGSPMFASRSRCLSFFALFSARGGCAAGESEYSEAV